MRADFNTLFTAVFCSTRKDRKVYAKRQKEKETEDSNPQTQEALAQGSSQEKEALIEACLNKEYSTVNRACQMESK